MGSNSQQLYQSMKLFFRVSLYSFFTHTSSMALVHDMQELEKTKPVVLTGDLNCAHEEIDIFNPAVTKT